MVSTPEAPIGWDIEELTQSPRLVGQFERSEGAFSRERQERGIGSDLELPASTDESSRVVNIMPAPQPIICVVVRYRVLQSLTEGGCAQSRRSARLATSVTFLSGSSPGFDFGHGRPEIGRHYGAPSRCRSVMPRRSGSRRVLPLNLPMTAAAAASGPTWLLSVGAECSRRDARKGALRGAHRGPWT